MKKVKMSRYDKMIGSLRWLFSAFGLVWFVLLLCVLFMFIFKFFKVDEWITLVSSL